MLAALPLTNSDNSKPSWLAEVPSLETVKAELARRELLEFIRFTMPEYVAEPFHVTLCAYLDRVVAGEIKRLMVFAPPQHGKSEIVSRRFPAYALGRNPDLRIIGASYSAQLAGRMNRDVQRIIDSDRYRMVFPNTRIPDANNRTQAFGALRNSDIFEVMDTKGSYRPAGRGQGITGMSCELAILDDPVEGAEEANSPTIREATWEWYNCELATRMSSSGATVLTMTRWSRDDLAGRLLQAENHGWTVLTFPAIAPEQPAAYDSRQPGEALCPSRYNLKALEQIKRERGPVRWSALYDQNPRPEGANEFPDEWFGPDSGFDNDPDEWVCKVLALDPSKGKKETKDGDYSAFVKLAIDRQGAGWCEAYLDRIPLSQIAATAVALCEEWQPDAFVCEAVQFQELLADQISNLSRARGIAIRATPIEDKTPKKVRIRRLTPFLARGEIRYKRHSHGTRLLVEQLQDFPNGAHDDGPDALEMAVRKACELMRGAELEPEYV